MLRKNRVSTNRIGQSSGTRRKAIVNQVEPETLIATHIACDLEIRTEGKIHVTSLDASDCCLAGVPDLQLLLVWPIPVAHDCPHHSARNEHLDRRDAERLDFAPGRRIVSGQVLEIFDLKRRFEVLQIEVELIDQVGQALARERQQVDAFATRALICLCSSDRSEAEHGDQGTVQRRLRQ